MSAQLNVTICTKDSLEMLFLSSILCKSVFVHVLENKTNTFTCINLVHSSVWSFPVALTTGGQQKQDFQISGVSC